MASGLDTLTSNILPGESGGLPTDVEKSPTPPLTEFSNISMGPKGTKTPLDASSSEQILANMQKFIDERSNPYSKFISNLDDARAAAVSNVHGEGTNAVTARETQKQNAAKDLFDMQNQMIAFKAAQKLNEQEQANYDKTYGSGAQTQTQTTPGTATTGYGGASGGISPEVLKRAAMLRASGNRDAADKLLTEAVTQLNKAQSELAYSPTQTEIVDVWVNGEKQQMTRADASKYVARNNPNAIVQPAGLPPPGQAQPVAEQTQTQPAASGFDTNVSKLITREGGYKPADSNGAPVNFGINQKANPDVDVKNLTQDKAKELYKTRYWDTIDGDHLPPGTAAVAFDAAANWGPEYAKKLIAKTNGDPEAMLTQRMQDYVDLVKKDPTKAPLLNGWLNRLQDVRKGLELGQIATQARSTQTQTKNAPVVQAPVVGGTGKGSGEVQQALSQKAGEANIEVQKSGETSEQSKIREGAGAREAALKTVADPKTIAELRNSADTIINIAKNYPQIFALTNRGDWKSTIAAIAPKIPILGGDTENVIAQSTLNPNELVKRSQANSAGSKLQADWAKDAFAGSRMEQAFLTLAKTAKGVSVSDPAQANIFNATVIKNMADYLDQKRDAWTNYKQTHDNPKFEDFEDSDPMRAIDKAAENRIRNQYPDVFGKKQSLKDKFPKKAVVEVGKSTIEGHPNE